jgi:predicted amidohydrolase
MGRSIKLSVVQFTPAFGRKQENIERLRKMTRGIKTDIIVFPELCTTGYLFLNRNEVQAEAESLQGPSVTFFRELAGRLNAVVVAGFAERDGNRLYNSCIVRVPEDPAAHIYRKTHLFYREATCFDPGNTGFLVVHDVVRDIKIGPMVCYDWRFPESARVLALLGADLIVCPANLVTDAWRIVMPARAVENKVYLAVANRSGIEKRGTDTLRFKGHSAVYNYDGVEMQRAGSRDDGILHVAIDPEATRDKSFNAVNDVLKDRRPEYYGRLVE